MLSRGSRTPGIVPRCRFLRHGHRKARARPDFVRAASHATLGFAMGDLAGRKPTPPSPEGAWFPRVLVVEDSLTRRTWIGDWLHERGFPFKTAKDGMEALELIQRTPPEARPELIVSDVRMPRMTGPELAKALKAG